MALSHSLEATQELRNILWKPKVQYRALVSILSQINPAHTTSLSKVHLNIIHYFHL
jgi:hypothetical protein